MTIGSGVSYYYQRDNFYIAGEKERYKIRSVGSATAFNVGPSNHFLVAGHMFATPEKDVASKCGASFNGFWYAASHCASYAYVPFNHNPPSWRSSSYFAVHTEIKIRPLSV